MTRPSSGMAAGAWRLFSALWSLANTWLAVSLMSRWFQYFDIGINPGAGNGFLYFFVAPVLLVLLHAFSLLASVLIGRLVARRWLARGLVVVLVSGAGFAVFLGVAWHYRDYPGEKPKDVVVFLKDVAREAAAPEP